MKDELVVIHQPDFIPYIGFFHRLLLADIYIVLDNVQFVSGSKNCWVHRDKIKTQQGEKWITIPCQKSPLGTDICDIYINNNINWKEQHLNQLEQNYKRANGFSEVFPYIQELYKPEYVRLVDLTFASIKMLMELLDLHTKIYFASDLKPDGKSNERVVNLVRKVNAHRYLSGIGALAYFEQKVFDQNGIEVIWQQFVHPLYPQQFGEFIPYLSSIDILLNCGIESSRKILRGIV